MATKHVKHMIKETMAEKKKRQLPAEATARDFEGRLHRG
jgi:hypothetical protein